MKRYRKPYTAVNSLHLRIPGAQLCLAMVGLSAASVSREIKAAHGEMNPRDPTVLFRAEACYGRDPALFFLGILTWGALHLTQKLVLEENQSATR